MRRAALAGCFLLTLCVGCSTTQDPIQTYRMGERVQAGPLAYNALSTNWLLTLGEGAGGRVPSNRYLLVRVAVSNEGATDSGVPTMSLVDDRGQTYNELTDGTGVADWLGLVRRLKPIESMQGNVVFDVTARHYKLRVADETDQIVSYIDLPLTLNLDDKAPQ